MNIELTEEEALNLYSQRYLKRWKKIVLIVFGLSFVITMLIYAVFWDGNLGSLALLIMAPAIIWYLSLIKKSSKYARSQLEGQN